MLFLGYIIEIIIFVSLGCGDVIMAAVVLEL